jgi:hypothetical protein
VHSSRSCQLMGRAGEVVILGISGPVWIGGSRLPKVYLSNIAALRIGMRRIAQGQKTTMSFALMAAGSR